MSKSINPKNKETIVNEEKIKLLGIKKSSRTIKTTNSTGKLLKENQILKKGLQKSQRIDSSTKGNINIETQKKKNTRDVQSVNVERTQPTMSNKQLSPQQKQVSLFEKKKSLQKQLQKVRIQLKAQFDSKKTAKSNIKTSTKHQQQDDLEAFKRVNKFLRKMRKQKQQLLLKKKKSHEKQLTIKMQQENQKYQALLADQQRLKEQRRKSIQQKIQQQKVMAQLRIKINKRSNSLIHQLLTTYNPDCKDTTQRVESQISQDIIGQNQCYSQSFRPMRKKYEISPFLSQVFKQQAEKRKQQQLKIMERKRVQTRHKEYAEKTRAKTKMSVCESGEIQ